MNKKSVYRNQEKTFAVLQFHFVLSLKCFRSFAIPFRTKSEMLSQFYNSISY